MVSTTESMFSTTDCTFILYVLLLPVDRIGFENITFSVEEEAGFAELSVALLGGSILGGRVTIRFHTSDISSVGQQHHCTCVSMCFNTISPTII